jgi:hypothetical protein
MRGDRVTVGRDTPGITNDLSFANRFVSRRHLVISRDGFQADDVRSLNGATINADQLPYGMGIKLSDGAIISLANKEVLQFTTQRPTPLSPPPSTWAIFIDGSTRSYVYLTEPIYSVQLTSDGLRIEKGETRSALLKIRRGQQKYFSLPPPSGRWSSSPWKTITTTVSGTCQWADGLAMMIYPRVWSSRPIARKSSSKALRSKSCR